LHNYRRSRVEVHQQNRTMTSSQIWILILAIAGSLTTILGLFWSTRQAIKKSPTDGVFYINEGTRWELTRGPIVGTVGVVALLGCTLLQLFP
jgi:hypothetical protein